MKWNSLKILESLQSAGGTSVSECQGVVAIRTIYLSIQPYHSTIYISDLEIEKSCALIDYWIVLNIKKLICWNMFHSRILKHVIHTLRRDLQNLLFSLSWDSCMHFPCVTALKPQAKSHCLNPKTLQSETHLKLIRDVKLMIYELSIILVKV